MIRIREFEQPYSDLLEVHEHNWEYGPRLTDVYIDMKQLYERSNRNVFMGCYLQKPYDDDDEMYYVLRIEYDDLIEKAVNKILKYYGLV